MQYGSCPQVAQVYGKSQRITKCVFIIHYNIFVSVYTYVCVGKSTNSTEWLGRSSQREYNLRWVLPAYQIRSVKVHLGISDKGNTICKDLDLSEHARVWGVVIWSVSLLRSTKMVGDGLAGRPRVGPHPLLWLVSGLYSVDSGESLGPGFWRFPRD